MSEDEVKMTRGQMQEQALVIESLLSTAMAMSCDEDLEDMLAMIEKASKRAIRLYRALDLVNAPEDVA